MRECTRGKAPARCAACRRCPLASLLHRDAQGTNGEAMTDMCLRRYVEQHVRERGGQEPTVPTAGLDLRCGSAPIRLLSAP